MSAQDQKRVPALQLAPVWTEQDQKKLDRRNAWEMPAFLCGLVGAPIGVICMIVAAVSAFHGMPILGSALTVLSGAGTAGSGALFMWSESGNRDLRNRKYAAREFRVKQAAQAELKRELASGPLLRKTRVIFPDPDDKAQRLILVIEPACDERDRRQERDIGKSTVHHATIRRSLAGNEYDLGIALSDRAPYMAQSESRPLIAGPQPAIPLPRLETLRPLPEPAPMPPEAKASRPEASPPARGLSRPNPWQ